MGTCQASYLPPPLFRGTCLCWRNRPGVPNNQPTPPSMMHMLYTTQQHATPTFHLKDKAAKSTPPCAVQTDGKRLATPVFCILHMGGKPWACEHKVTLPTCHQLSIHSPDTCQRSTLQKHHPPSLPSLPSENPRWCKIVISPAHPHTLPTQLTVSTHVYCMPQRPVAPDTTPDHRLPAQHTVLLLHTTASRTQERTVDHWDCPLLKSIVAFHMQHTDSKQPTPCGLNHRKVNDFNMHYDQKETPDQTEGMHLFAQPQRCIVQA
jgi:hypothetical protein